MSLNVTVLMGRLIADPELRTTQNNISNTRFTIAVDRGYVKSSEEKKADFITIVAWRQTAEFVCKYFKKGSMIAVNGAIQTGSYDDKDGNKRYTFEVVANNVSFTGGKNDSNSSNGNETNYSQPTIANTVDDFIPVSNEDLPF